MIYICGDLHGTYGPKEEEKFLKSLTKEDYLIVLGDFGWSWDLTHQKKFHLNCTTLFIDGNHENFDLLYSLPEETKFGNKVGIFNENTFWLKRGNLYTIEDKTFFCFGGAASIDKQYRLPGLSWWKEEIPSMSEYNHAIETLGDCNYTFDYFITHTCCTSEMYDTMKYRQIFNDSTTKMIDIMEDLIKEHGSYKHNFYGHHHIYGHNDKHTAMYTQVYCLDTDETKFF